MIKHGEPPYLECSSRGDRRYSAYFARLPYRNYRTIEDLYQSFKIFPPTTEGVNATGNMLNWKDAKGKAAINQVEAAAFYEQLWREYLSENSVLLEPLMKASGLSDMFGQPGSVCQATVLWKLRSELLLK